MKTVYVTIYGKEAKEIAEEVGLEMIGDETDVNTKVIIKKESAEGRHKVSIEFDV